MADPKSLGNRADELGYVEEGGTFDGLNQSRLSEAGAPIEVKTERVGNDLALTPERKSQDFKRGIGELSEPRDAILMAQVLEEPVPVNGMVVYGAKDRIAEVSKRSPREALIWFGVRAKVYAAVTGDRVLVKQDTLESEHSCRECHGKGHGDVKCAGCNGTGKVGSLGCARCVVTGFDREESDKYSSGWEKCGACFGCGWRGGIIIPEIAQSKPISGIVVSLGPETRLTMLGDRVLHSKFAGHTQTTPEGESFTIMHESEILELLMERP